MDALKEKIRKEVERLGFYLYDLTLAPRRGEKVLSVKIDHEDPVSIDDCVRVSEHLSAFLDDVDPIESAYVLEVTSAGAEHTLRDFEEMHRARGRFVYVKTPDTEVRGHLRRVSETSVDVEDKQGKLQTVFVTDIEKIRLAIDF